MPVGACCCRLLPACVAARLLWCPPSVLPQVLFGAIIVPYALLWVGVIKQATLPLYAQERQAVYASCLLLALMTVYTASVGVCLWIFHCVQQQESEESRAQEVDWQPHDMMFFMVRRVKKFWD